MAEESERGGAERCELCGRQIGELTKHHLIPRTRHRNKRLRKRFSLEEMKARVAWLCDPCHKTVHAVFTEKELEAEFNTLEALRAHPDVREFIKWLRTHPNATRLSIRRTHRRRGRRRGD